MLFVNRMDWLATPGAEPSDVIAIGVVKIGSVSALNYTGVQNSQSLKMLAVYVN